MAILCVDRSPPTWTGLGFDANQAYVVQDMDIPTRELVKGGDDMGKKEGSAMVHYLHSLI
jgi:hypothetical protein